MNENIFILLDELKHYLIDLFKDAKYFLEMNFEPENSDRFIILMIRVSDDRFFDGAFEDLFEIRKNILPLRRQYNVLTELAIMVDVLNV